MRCYGKGNRRGGQPTSARGRWVAWRHDHAREDRPIWWAAFRNAIDLGVTTDYSVRVRLTGPPHVMRVTGRTGPLSQDGRIVGVIAYGFQTHHANAPETAQRFLLCQTGWKVVRYLAPLEEPVKAAAIAVAIDELDGRGQPGTKLRLLLGNMVERRILHLSGGYVLAPEFHLMLGDMGG